MIQEPL